LQPKGNYRFIFFSVCRESFCHILNFSLPAREWNKYPAGRSTALRQQDFQSFVLDVTVSAVVLIAFILAEKKREKVRREIQQNKAQ